MSMFSKYMMLRLGRAGKTFMTNTTVFLSIRSRFRCGGYEVNNPAQNYPSKYCIKGFTQFPTQ